jgi:hypothetical protein
VFTLLRRAPASMIRVHTANDARILPRTPTSPHHPRVILTLAPRSLNGRRTRISPSLPSSPQSPQSPPSACNPQPRASLGHGRRARIPQSPPSSPKPAIPVTHEAHAPIGPRLVLPSAPCCGLWHSRAGGDAYRGTSVVPNMENPKLVVSVRVVARAGKAVNLRRRCLHFVCPDG